MHYEWQGLTPDDVTETNHSQRGSVTCSHGRLAGQTALVPASGPPHRAHFGRSLICIPSGRNSGGLTGGSWRRKRPAGRRRGYPEAGPTVTEPRRSAGTNRGSPAQSRAGAGTSVGWCAPETWPGTMSSEGCPASLTRQRGCPLRNMQHRLSLIGRHLPTLRWPFVHRWRRRHWCTNGRHQPRMYIARAKSAKRSISRRSTWRAAGSDLTNTEPR